MTSPAQIARERIREDLAKAMSDRDIPVAKLLRALIAAIDNAEAVPVEQGGPYRELPFGDASVEVPRKVLDSAAVAAVIEAEAKERENAAALFRANGQSERAATLDSEADVARRYLAG